MSEQTDSTYDLIVLGGGPGGYSGAIRAARTGWRVALVEAEERLGGVCLNWGCIPTKTLLHQAHLLTSMQQAERTGLRVRGEIGFDWPQVIARSREVTDSLAAGIAGLMRRHKIEVIQGRGRLTPSGNVDVTDAAGTVRQLAGERVLLATGGRPRTLPDLDLAEHPRVFTSREAMVLGERPRSIVIVGAGAIGLEFARFFSAFGTKVTLLEAADQVLPTEDPDVAAIVHAGLVEAGVDVHCGVTIEKVDGGPRRRTASVSWRDGDGEVVTQRSDLALIAIGVTGNIEDLGLEALGIRTAKGAIVVDADYRTASRKVWAIGDVIGGACLAHAATAEAVAAVDVMTDRQKTPLAGPIIPACVYGEPEVASVGMSEARAREQGLDIRIGRFPFAASGRALAVGESKGFIKLIFAAEYGELLGASLVGPGVTELIGELCLAIQLEATWEELAHTVHAHPTLSEGIMEAAAAAFGEAIHI